MPFVQVTMKQFVIFALTFWALITPCVLGLSWGRYEKPTRRLDRAEPRFNVNPPETLNTDSYSSNVYAVALKELQELESAPLCHRVAARLLVNSCELVDGKDEATILTESGPKIRDFVDAYAASLAICDLERGSFVIPVECTMFQENALNKAALQNQAQILVTSSQIDACLTALARSDAAWNTWVSYRHKAARFCEAARADNEKTQNILLYQRLTMVLGKLAEGVELDLQKRMNDLEAQTRHSLENLEQISPGIEELRSELAKVHEYLSGDLRDSVKKSSEFLNEGLASAETIQQLLAVLVKSMLEGNSHLAKAVASHEMSMQQATSKANDDVHALMAVVTTAVASSTSLQQQIALSRLQAAELANQQNALEEGLNRLINVTENLSAKYDDHTQLLDQANNKTYEVLDTLEATAAKAASVNESLQQESKSSGWWPYIVCPTASLVMGSYGLPPSAFRNLGLLALGEVIGFMVSSAKHIDTEFLFSATGKIVNGTDVMDSSL